MSLVVAVLAAAGLTDHAHAATCEGARGKELQACLEAAYPAQFPLVEARCADRGKGADRWACRRDEYAALGITIDPPVLRDAEHGVAAVAEDPVPAAEVPEGAATPELATTPATERETPVLDAIAAASEFLESARGVCDVHEPVPLSLVLWVSNPQDMAIKEKGSAMVALGNAAAYFGVTDSVDSQVYDTIVDRARSSFAEKGIEASVSRARRTLPQTAAYTWSERTRVTRKLNPGVYELISVTVHDSIGVACQEKGDLVGVAVKAGASGYVEQKVRDTVERKLLKQLRKYDGEAYILGSD